jgi:hypothetical protein
VNKETITLPEIPESSWNLKKKDENRLSSQQIDALPKVDKYMMATTAMHQLGDISSNEPDLCRVSKESETDYYGMWVTGFGFFNVRFPKETTRELTKKEIDKYNSTYIQLSNYPPQKLKVD